MRTRTRAGAKSTTDSANLEKEATAMSNSYEQTQDTLLCFTRNVLLDNKPSCVGSELLLISQVSAIAKVGPPNWGACRFSSMRNFLYVGQTTLGKTNRMRTVKTMQLYGCELLARVAFVAGVSPDSVLFESESDLSQRCLSFFLSLSQPLFSFPTSTEAVCMLFIYKCVLVI